MFVAPHGGHKILWRASSDCEGSGDGAQPFVVLGNKRLECHQGPDRNLCAKQKRQKQRQVV